MHTTPHRPTRRCPALDAPQPPQPTLPPRRRPRPRRPAPPPPSPPPPMAPPPTLHLTRRSRLYQLRLSCCALPGNQSRHPALPAHCRRPALHLPFTAAPPIRITARFPQKEHSAIDIPGLPHLYAPRVAIPCLAPPACPAVPEHHTYSSASLSCAAALRHPRRRHTPMTPPCPLCAPDPPLRTIGPDDPA